MATYVVDGQSYYFVNEIGQEKAEEIIAKRKGQSTDITEEPEGTYEDPKYEGFFTEAGEGVVSGAIGIVQGLAETVSLVPDLIFDTNYGSSVTKFANDLRDAGGIDPAGAVGKITEAVVQFGIPGITAANIVSKAGRVARIAKGTPKTNVKKVKGTTIKTKELGFEESRPTFFGKEIPFATRKGK